MINIALKQRKYSYDVSVLKKYNDDYYKLVKHNILRNKGIEVDDIIKAERGTVNDYKLLQSISRAKSKITEYGLCNDWDYFATLTIDKSKFDRFNLKAYYTKFAQWLRNYQKKHDIKIEYIFIPEQHKDGAWHLHGLIRGLPAEHLTVNQYNYFDWDAYRNKFGYISLDHIQDQTKVTHYILKYVGKGFGLNIQELNAKLYYCSKGLKTAETIKKGSISVHIEPDWCNKYIAIKKLNSAEADEILQLFD